MTKRERFSFMPLPPIYGGLVMTESVLTSQEFVTDWSRRLHGGNGLRTVRHGRAGCLLGGRFQFVQLGRKDGRQFILRSCLRLQEGCRTPWRWQKVRRSCSGPAALPCPKTSSRLLESTGTLSCDGAHMRLHAPAEEAAVVLAGLHHQGKIGQLGGSVVNIQPVQVVFQ